MTADVVSTVFFASLEHRVITNGVEPFIFVALEFVTPFLKSKKFDCGFTKDYLKNIIIVGP